MELNLTLHCCRYSLQVLWPETTARVSDAAHIPVCLNKSPTNWGFERENVYRFDALWTAHLDCCLTWEKSCSQFSTLKEEKRQCCLYNTAISRDGMRFCRSGRTSFQNYHCFKQIFIRLRRSAWRSSDSAREIQWNLLRVRRCRRSPGGLSACHGRPYYHIAIFPGSPLFPTNHYLLPRLISIANST